LGEIEMNIKSWQDVLLEVVETDPADFTDRRNICISPEDLGNILRSALAERDAEIERLTLGWNAANVDVLHHAMTIEKLREAARLALDALTYQGTMGPTRRQRRAEATTALREALK
jgi:hypothetical protein